MKKYFEARKEKLLTLLKRKRCDGAVFLATSRTYDPNIRYFTGMRLEPHYTFVCLLVTKDSYKLYFSRGEEAGPLYVDEVRVVSKKDEFKSELKKEIKSWKRVAINYNSFLLSHSNLLGRKRKVDIGRDLLKLRSRKDELEVKSLKKVCYYTDLTARELLSSFTEFGKENELASFLFDRASKLGAQLAFSPIVATGKRSSQVHPVPSYTTSPLRRVTLVDFGLRMDGYCSDLTLTIFDRKPQESELSMIEVLDGLVQEIEEGIIEGLSCGKLFLRFKEILMRLNQKPQHALGHGIGLEVHELPSLSESSRERIQINSTFTLEPGMYLKDFGLRVENCYLLVNRKLLRLTKNGGIYVL